MNNEHLFFIWSALLQGGLKAVVWTDVFQVGYWFESKYITSVREELLVGYLALRFVRGLVVEMTGKARDYCACVITFFFFWFNSVS